MERLQLRKARVARNNGETADGPSSAEGGWIWTYFRLPVEQQIIDLTVGLASGEVPLLLLSRLLAQVRGWDRRTQPVVLGRLVRPRL